MKKILLLAFGCLIALPALTQIRNVPTSSLSPQLVLPDDSYVNAKVESQAKIDSTKAAQIPAERKFAIIEYKDNDAYLDSFYVKKLITNVVLIEEGTVTKRDTQTDTAALYLPADGKTVFVGTTTWHENVRFDTTWTEVARIDDPATNNTSWSLLTNISKAANVSGKNVYNKSFSYVTVASSKSVLELKPVAADRLEFFSEHYPTHGLVKVFIDGPDGTWQQIATLNQNATVPVTDFERMQPSFSYIWPKALWNDPMKPHKIKFETDAGNQYLMDFIRVVKMTLTPRVPKKVTK
jgi:hypothetical protein